MFLFKEIQESCILCKCSEKIGTRLIINLHYLPLKKFNCYVEHIAQKLHNKIPKVFKTAGKLFITNQWIRKIVNFLQRFYQHF